MESKRRTPPPIWKARSILVVVNSEFQHPDPIHLIVSFHCFREVGDVGRTGKTGGISGVPMFLSTYWGHRAPFRTLLDTSNAWHLRRGGLGVIYTRMDPKGQGKYQEEGPEREST